MSETGEVAQLVRSRAADRCEYCRMHQSLQGSTFHIDHVVPRCNGGEFTRDNLAWCCPACNLHKASQTVAPDPGNGAITSLVNPRRQKWEEHFKWNGYRLVGRTATGRATARALRFNEARRLRIRKAEELFELFPP